MKILIATGNEGKKKEMLEAFRGHVLDDLEVLSLKDVDVAGDVEETGKTFEENALLKARFFGDQAGIPTIGEDSGLILSAFPEKFGLRTRRELDAKDDIEWMEKFLDLMEGVEERAATFFSATGFYDPVSKQEASFLGQTAGSILDMPQTEFEPGIPVSSIFLANGQDRVYSALSREEKNAISHRGKSVKQLVEFLRQL